MIEVTIDSVRVSLMSQHRVVVLKEYDGEHYLPIWIGPFEADAITVQLQGVEVTRPMTHDLLMSIITRLEAQVTRVLIHDLHSETFFATVVIDTDGEIVEVDARPSDAIALAVRARVPIFVAETVMNRAGILSETDTPLPDQQEPRRKKDKAAKDEDGLDIFREFVEGLDLDSLGD